MHAAIALLLALEHRRATGEGQLVEATMVEAALNAAVEPVLEWSAYGQLLARDGNRGPVAVPQNVYACRGVERWLALAVVTDAQWAALVAWLGGPAWARDPTLATAAGRRARQDALDGELARAFAACERDEVVEALLARGIPAAPVVTAAQVAENPQLRARGFFETVEHPVVGVQEYQGLPIRLPAGSTRWYRRPAPALGEHTEEVLREILGLRDDELAALRVEAVIGKRPVGT
jgi:crotonobetainyl-CoA:carnitine CoA-transferase CaiB-like acyl-CoA transferase